MVGTPQYWSDTNPSDSDLLYEWKNKKNKQVFLLPAFDEFEEPTCPELHSKEFLIEQKESMSERAWSKEYMLTPIVETEKTVDESHIARCRDDMSTYYEDYVPRPDELMILGTDYAIIDNPQEAERKNSAYFALVVVAYNLKTNIRYIKNIFYTR